MRQQQTWKGSFFTFWTAQAFSLFGSNLAQFALVWWLTDRTRSATVLALATLVATLPGIVIGPFAGALVDRWDRRTIIILADTASACIAAVLALLFWSGTIQVWHIYMAMGLRAIATAFHLPAVQSSTSLMVPTEQLARVAGLNQMLLGLMMIVAPPLGALLLELLPFEGLMGVDIATAVIAIGLVLCIRIPSQHASTPASQGAASLLQDMRAGLRYIWHWPGLMGIMTISTLLNLLLIPAFSLLPILVTNYFGGQALQLAWINMALGIGSVAGGLFLGVWGGFHRRIVTVIMGLSGIGVGVLMIGLAPANLFALALAGMFIAGVMSPMTNGPIIAIMQSVVAPEMQGRVFTVLTSSATAMSPIGLAVAGPVADWIGVRTWYVFGAVACFITTGIILCTSTVMNLEDHGTKQDAQLLSQ